MTLDEWVDLPDAEDKSLDGRGRHESAGYSGKFKAAENHAPPDATFEEIRDVASEAFERRVSVQQVWHEQQSDLSEF